MGPGAVWCRLGRAGRLRGRASLPRVSGGRTTPPGPPAPPRTLRRSSRRRPTTRAGLTRKVPIHVSPAETEASTSPATDGVFARFAGHEQVVFCHDEPTGLKAIIAIYSTALGPALGGTRFYPYASEADALTDVLHLSRAMAYKNALAGLDLGGGKAVIWGDPAHLKSEALLRAYGRFVQSLNGRYYTACDVGTYVADMDVVARETRFVTGRSVEHGGAGDSSVLTAWGVFQGMRAAAEHLWGTPSLRGRTVGVSGLGKVGKYLAGHLLDDGAAVIATDVNEGAREWARVTHPEIGLVDDTEALI